jgi:hypothetical protein
VKTAYERPIRSMIAYSGFIIFGGMRGKEGDTPNTICANSTPKIIVLR